MSVLLCDRMGRPAGRNRQKTEMILYAGHIHRFQAEAGKTNPVTRSAVAGYSPFRPPRHCPAKTGYPSPVPPTRQSSPAGLPPAGGFPGNEPDKPAPLSIAMFPESAPFPSPCSVPRRRGEQPDRETACTGYRPYPLFPFSSPYSFLLLYPEPAVTYHVDILSVPLARFAPCRFPSAASPLSCPSFRVWHPVPYRPARPVMLRQ